MQEVLKTLENLNTSNVIEIRHFLERAAWPGADYSKFLANFPQAVVDSDNKANLARKVAELKSTWDAFEAEWNAAEKDPNKDKIYRGFTSFNVMGFSNMVKDINSKLKAHPELKIIVQSREKEILEIKKIDTVVKGMESRASTPRLDTATKLHDTQVGIEGLIKEASLSGLYHLLTILQDKNQLKHLHAETKFFGQTTLRSLINQIQHKAHELLDARIQDKSITEDDLRKGEAIAHTKVGVSFFKSKEETQNAATHADNFSNLKTRYQSIVENPSQKKSPEDILPPHP
ncbi:hypothetical protein [Legionella gresilensis]|uniref:hypothetical protein n=1 Tax=Legionella gresilensis TaxID=91823 RepID=UPI0010418029|nr:hypothetical protein [Legionella gresilensis]